MSRLRTRREHDVCLGVQRAEELTISISRPRCAQDGTSDQASRIAGRDFGHDPMLMRLAVYRYAVYRCMDQVCPAVVSLQTETLSSRLLRCGSSVTLLLLLPDRLAHHCDPAPQL